MKCHWIQVAADSTLPLTRVPAAGYELWLSRVPAAGYKLRLIPSYGLIDFQQQDKSCSWLRPTNDLSSDSWIRVTADPILRLTRVPAAGYDLRLIPSCGLTRVLAARYELQLILSCGWLEFYTLIYQVNLRTYSAKYIIFMVCFLPTDFSYHWFRLWLLLQESWRSLKKLEEAWRSFKTLAVTDSSCSGWFELRRLIRELRPID